jgi:hypothetical protein
VKTTTRKKSFQCWSVKISIHVVWIASIISSIRIRAHSIQFNAFSANRILLEIMLQNFGCFMKLGSLPIDFEWREVASEEV